MANTAASRNRDETDTNANTDTARRIPAGLVWYPGPLCPFPADLAGLKGQAGQRCRHGPQGRETGRTDTAHNRPGATPTTGRRPGYRKKVSTGRRLLLCPVVGAPWKSPHNQRSARIWTNPAREEAGVSRGRTDVTANGMTRKTTCKPLREQYESMGLSRRTQAVKWFEPPPCSSAR